MIHIGHLKKEKILFFTTQKSMYEILKSIMV